MKGWRVSICHLHLEKVAIYGTGSPLLTAAVLTFKLEVLGIAQHLCSQSWWSCISLLKGVVELS